MSNDMWFHDDPPPSYEEATRTTTPVTIEPVRTLDELLDFLREQRDEVINYIIADDAIHALETTIEAIQNIPVEWYEKVAYAALDVAHALPWLLQIHGDVIDIRYELLDLISSYLDHIRTTRRNE